MKLEESKLGRDAGGATWLAREGEGTDPIYSAGRRPSILIRATDGLGPQLFQTLIAVKRILEIEAYYYTYNK